MSDVSQGPGWWQASDGKWYPPEQAPQAPPPAAPTTGGPSYAAPAGPGYGAPGSPSAYGTPAGAPVGGAGQLVEWPQRVIAYLVDAGFIFAGFVAVFIVSAIFGAISDVLGALVLFLGYLALVGASFYFAYLTGLTGQSPGKRIIGIRVISEENGQPIGGGQGVVRQIAHVLDGFCLIGYLFPLWDPKKQTFADKIMKTVVVPGPKQNFGPEIFKP